MICPKCMTEARIGTSKYLLEDGKLFYEQDFYCRNTKCPNNDQVVGTVRSELPLGSPDTSSEVTEDTLEEE